MKTFVKYKRLVFRAHPLTLHAFVFFLKFDFVLNICLIVVVTLESNSIVFSALACRGKGGWVSNQYKSVSCLQPCESRSELGTADPIVELSRLAIFSFLFFFFFLTFLYFMVGMRQKSLLRSIEPPLSCFDTNKTWARGWRFSSLQFIMFQFLCSLIRKEIASVLFYMWETMHSLSNWPSYLLKIWNISMSWVS